MDLKNYKEILVNIYKIFPEFKKVVNNVSEDYVKFLYFHLNNDIKLKISLKDKIKTSKDILDTLEIKCDGQYCEVLLMIYHKFFTEEELKIIRENNNFFVIVYREEYSTSETDEYFMDKNRRDFLIPCFYHERTKFFLNNMNYIKDRKESYNERFKRFHLLLGSLRKYIKTKERLGVMIDSSFTLSVYNIRRFKDIDLVILHPYNYNNKVRNNIKFELVKKYDFLDVFIPNIQIDWTIKTKPVIDENTRKFTDNKLENYYEAVFHPDYHYYFFGIKVIDIEYDLKYRANRRWPKNVADLILTQERLKLNIPKTKPLENQIKVGEKIYSKKEFIEVILRYLKKFNFEISYESLEEKISKLSE